MDGWLRIPMGTTGRIPVMHTSFYYYLCIVCILPAIISTLRAHSMHNNNINIIYIIQIYIYIACTGSYA